MGDAEDEPLGLREPELSDPELPASCIITGGDDGARLSSEEAILVLRKAGEDLKI
jgi:hypothetical protein